jgi:predicted regulator of Ras-like GTPase activity (Roadblock/LC7/MglB family)
MSTKTASVEVPAKAAVAALVEESAGLRACALLDPEGLVLARSTAADWSSSVAEIWAAALDAARPEPTQVHVATEDGEVYAVRGRAGFAVAVTDRFTLASLVFCDLRAALRRVGTAER